MRTLSNSTTAVHKQCTVCGQSLAGAISKSKYTPEQLASMPLFDDDLAKNWWDQIVTDRKVVIKAQQEEFQKLKIFNKAEYEEYLKSPEWRAKRNMVLERDKHMCQGCMDAQATEVHHHTYSHIYRELLFQLVSVCRKCHATLHEKDRAL